MKGLQWLRAVAPFPSREKLGVASGSEIRRWMAAGNVIVNGEPLLADEEIDFPVFSLVLFPKGKRITVY